MFDCTQDLRIDSLPARSGNPQRDLADVLYQVVDISPGTLRTVLPDLLEAIRLHLGMDVGFLSRFADGRRIFEFVSDDGKYSPISAGDSDPLEESYCLRMAEGKIPGVIQNAQEHQGVQDLGATHDLQIGAHISVLVHLQGGEIYGTLCCFSTQADETLDSRDLNFMSVIADLIGAMLQREISYVDRIEQKRNYLDDAIHSGALHAVWQPIIDIESNRVVSVEALARFNTRPYRPPNEWFDQAAEVGRSTQLERNALIKGLDILPELPGSVRISCNLSGPSLLDPEIQAFLHNRQLDRLVLEITEHDIIADYSSLVEALKPLREAGMMLAIDDFGAGYASFRHILGLNPEIIKVDMSMVRNIDTNETAQAVVRALTTFASENCRWLVAEGVETESELQTLRGMGVTRIQGHLLYKPMDHDDLLQALAPTPPH